MVKGGLDIDLFLNRGIVIVLIRIAVFDIRGVIDVASTLLLAS